MEEYSNDTVSIKKRNMFVIVIVVIGIVLVAILILLLLGDSQKDYSENPDAPPSQPTTQPSPDAKPNAEIKLSTTFSSNFYRDHNNVSFTFLDNEYNSVKTDGTMKVTIKQVEEIIYYKEFIVRSEGFESTVTHKQVFVDGKQEIVDVVNYLFKISIITDEIKKGIESDGQIYFEFISTDGQVATANAKVKDLPIDPARFSGDPEEMRGPWVEPKTDDYMFAFELYEKSFRVSATGTLVVTGEDKNGTVILSKTIQVVPSDFGFEPIKKSYAHVNSDTNLKYVGSFLRSEIKEDECISLLRFTFTTIQGIVLEKETTRRSNCYLWCNLERSC